MSDQTSPATDTNKPPEPLHLPSEWMALCPKIPQRLVKLGCALAGLDPTEEDAEPIDRQAFDLLVQSARDKLVAVKAEQQQKGVNPLLVYVLPASTCMHAVIAKRPDVGIAAQHLVNSGADGEDRPPDAVMLNNATSFWGADVLWPTIGSKEQEILQMTLQYVWCLYPVWHRNGLMGILKKRA